MGFVFDGFVLIELQLERKGFDTPHKRKIFFFFNRNKRKKMVVLFATFDFTNYSLYTVYHLPLLAHKRISQLLLAFLSKAKSLNYGWIYVCFWCCEKLACECGLVGLRKKLAFVLFKKIIQHFAPFSKLIREMFLFWNSIFSKSS